LKNLNAILKEAGTDIQNTVKVNIFVSSMNHYANVNRAYLEVFSGTPKPVCSLFVGKVSSFIFSCFVSNIRKKARTCVAAAQLPNAEAAVEIELVAALPDNASTRKVLSRL
jgi:enamine deaminase RidA (YjgF/YER057c/UK114 family)